MTTTGLLAAPFIPNDLVGTLLRIAAAILLVPLSAVLGWALGYGLDAVWRGPMVRRVKL